MNFEFAWISNDSTSLGGGLALHFVPPPREEEEGKGEQVSEGGRFASVHARHWVNGSLDDASLPLSFKGSGGTFRRTSVTLGPQTDMNLLQDLLLRPKMMQNDSCHLFIFCRTIYDWAIKRHS